MRSSHVGGILLLSGIAFLSALGIVAGEVTDRWFFGGAMIGVLLLAYSFIVLLLRKMGIIGPRKAER